MDLNNTRFHIDYINFFGKVERDECYGLEEAIGICISAFEEGSADPKYPANILEYSTMKLMGVVAPALVFDEDGVSHIDCYDTSRRPSGR
jgi:hypothetical protein